MLVDSSLSTIRLDLDALAALRDALRVETSVSRTDLRQDFDALAYRLDLVEAQHERVRAHMHRSQALLHELNLLMRILKQGFSDIEQAAKT